MTTHVPQALAVDALRDVWSRLDDLLDGVEAETWATPTSLPGWDVKDTVAHLVGTEAMLLGEPTPDVDIDRGRRVHVRNEIGAFNERWVAAMSGATPAEVLARFRDHTSRRLAALGEMSAAAWEAVGFTPAGKDTYGRFMRIRTFDCWLHEQDIRDAVGQPGGEGGPAAELALEEMAASMGFVVGKKAGAPAGSRVRFELTGPAARRIDVEVGERAAVVDELSALPTVTLTMPAGVFARLGGGRSDVAARREQVSIAAPVADGTELGERVLANLAYTI